MISYLFYRNACLSIIKALQDVVPSGVRVVDETEENLTTSAIGIYPNGILYKAFELGNETDSDVLTWFGAVYANTPAERDYLSLLVYNTLKSWSISVKDYSNAEAVLGTLYVDDSVRIEINRAPASEVDKLRYFSLISFQTTYQEA